MLTLGRGRAQRARRGSREGPKTFHRPQERGRVAGRGRWLLACLLPSLSVCFRLIALLSCTPPRAAAGVGEYDGDWGLGERFPPLSSSAPLPLLGEGGVP